MHAEATGTASATSTPSSGAAATKARILAAASELFYTQGIRATSADRIIEQVGITKVTFYRHFRTKSELVVAYLKEQSAAERGWMQSTYTKDDPVGSLRALATGIGEASCRPGFRGCAFINAAAEFADPDDPVRVAVEEHRNWMLSQFETTAAEAGAPDPETTARELMLLRDGGMVNGYLGDPASVTPSLTAAFTAVLATAQGDG